LASIVFPHITESATTQNSTKMFAFARVLTIVFIVATLSFSANAFKSSAPLISRRAHSASKSLNVVINNRNRDDRKIELPPNSLKSRKEVSGSRKNEPNTFFGFTKTSELLNGRIAMTFFLYGIYEEVTTGKSMLQQVGLTNQNDQTSMLAIVTLATCVALYPSMVKWTTKLSSMRLPGSDV
jgi:hypothetical protein